MAKIIYSSLQVREIFHLEFLRWLSETTQRFKVHLITAAGENLFTKVEFSRRHRSQGKVIVQPVSDTVLRLYKLPPLLIPHYDEGYGQKRVMNL